MAERDDTHLTDEQLAELRERLLSMRRRLLEEIQHEADEQQLARASREVGDAEDRASEESLLQLTYLLGHHDQQQLREVEDALRRMDEGTYGLCEETGEPIPYERLRVVPTARYGVEVQQEQEEAEELELEREMDREDQAYARSSRLYDLEESDLDPDLAPDPVDEAMHTESLDDVDAEAAEVDPEADELPRLE